MIDEILLDLLHVEPVVNAAAADAVAGQDRLVGEVHLRIDVDIVRNGEVEDVETDWDIQAVDGHVGEVIAGRRAAGRENAEPQGRVLVGGHLDRGAVLERPQRIGVEAGAAQVIGGLSQIDVFDLVDLG